MLILTRRPVETIYIGDEVTVTVLGVVGNQVRFGIEAPRHIVIDRAEIHERKKRAALANGSPVANGNVNGNVLEEEEAIAGQDHDRQPVNGNVATLKLRR
jgi:carbon storage regulator